MAANNYLEIDQKPSIFAFMVDSDEKNDDLAKDWFMPDAKVEIPEADNLLDVPPSVKTETITPIPGICIKTKTDKNEKVFINLCHHSAVPPPPQSINIEDIIESPEESLFHFPLSLGELRIEKDKSQHECMCLNAIINSDFYSEVLKNTRIRDFILTLIFSGFQQKYNITIDDTCMKIFTKPYYGKIVDQFIRVEPRKIEKIFDKNIPKKDTSMPELKLSILCNLVDSNAKGRELKKGNLEDDTNGGVTKVHRYNKTKIGIEICNQTGVTNEPIQPKSGLCAKTKTNKDEKLFINLCHHNALPHPPPSINVEDIFKISESELCVDFPLSLSELRVEKDKFGNECKCFDVVINGDFYHNNILKKGDLRDFVLILACTGIERKYNIIIDAGAIKILNKPYHGKIPDHFIKLLSKFQCSEKTSSFNEGMSKNIIMPEQDSSQIILFSPKIDYSLFQKPIDGKAYLLIFQSFITGISDENDLAVFVSKHQLTVEDKKGNILVKVPLDYSISPEKCISNFWNKRLTVAMPVEEKDTNRCYWK